MSPQACPHLARVITATASTVLLGAALSAVSHSLRMCASYIPLTGTWDVLSTEWGCSTPRPATWTIWSTWSERKVSTRCSSQVTSTTGHCPPPTPWSCSRTLSPGSSMLAPSWSCPVVTTTRRSVSASPQTSWLAEIATLANERLTTMSDGRYALEYTDARAAQGARSGFGLLVRDAWTGQTRETSSLSGGEAF